MKKIRVLIVDDHPVVREGLRMLLEQAGDIEVAGQAQDGLEAVDAARKLQPDVVVMDLSMPRMSGMEATKQIHAQVPASKILVLSTYGDDELVAHAVANGATGFLVKQSVVKDLLSGVRSVSHGNAFFSPSVSIASASLVIPPVMASQPPSAASTPVRPPERPAP